MTVHGNCSHAAQKPAGVERPGALTSIWCELSMRLLFFSPSRHLATTPSRTFSRMPVGESFDCAEEVVTGICLWRSTEMPNGRMLQTPTFAIPCRVSLTSLK